MSNFSEVKIDEIILESRIKANIVSFSGKMGIYSNCFKGNKIEINADENLKQQVVLKFLS